MKLLTNVAAIALAVALAALRYFKCSQAWQTDIQPVDKRPLSDKLGSALNGCSGREVASNLCIG